MPHSARLGAPGSCGGRAHQQPLSVLTFPIHSSSLAHVALTRSCDTGPVITHLTQSGVWGDNVSPKILFSTRRGRSPRLVEKRKVLGGLAARQTSRLGAACIR